jgi:hypothetical protein
VTAPAAPAPASARWLDLGVAARAEGGTAPAFGVELRAAGGWRWWGVEATAGILAPTESEHSSIDVRAQRFPLGLALTARLPISDRLAIAGAAGLSLVPLTVRAQGIEDARAQTRIDSGARLAVALWLRATPRLRPFVDLHAEIFPSPHHLVVDPLGDIGTTGRLWLGAAAGLAFETTPPPRAP